MSNKLTLVLLIILTIFGLSQSNFAEDQSSLAKFVIRNYDMLEVPNVGSNDPKYVIVEFFDYRCGYCGKQAYDYEKLPNFKKVCNFDVAKNQKFIEFSFEAFQN